MQKFIRKHIWVTKPDHKGVSYLGLTNFAKDYLLRLDKINHQQYFKTRYAIMNKYRIGSWVPTVRDRYLFKNNNQLLNSISSITASERIQIDRFLLKQGQPFSQLSTTEFDVELSAPITMRVIQSYFQAEFDGGIEVYRAEWLYKVEVFDVEGLDLLMNEQKYQKSNKIIEYEGMLL